MSDPDDAEARSPFGEAPNGGRLLLTGLFLTGVFLLAIIRWQTMPGTAGQTAALGGWWSEPALAPATALAILIISSAVAVFTARRKPINVPETAMTYLRIGAVSAWMLMAVWLISITGFALAMLIFSGGAALMAGFRGKTFACLCLGTTVAMVLVFRVGFGIWFPRPLLFKHVEFGSTLSGIL